MGAKKRPTDPSGNPWPAHPLFPVDDGELPPEVAYIQITRFEPGKGQLWVPRMHRGDEITSLEDVASLYGGGEYELVARGKDPTTGNPTTITKKQPWRIAGVSRPLGEIPKEAEQPPRGVDASALGALAGGGSALGLLAAGGRIDPMMLFLVLMMEQNKAAEARAERQQATMLAQNQSQNALLVEAMRASGGNSGALASALATALSAQKTTDPATMIAALAAAMKPSSDDASPMSILTAGMELGAKLKNGEGGGDFDLKSLLETLQAAGGVVGPIMDNERARNELEKEKVKAGASTEPAKPKIAIVPPPAPQKPDTPNGAAS